MSRLQRRKKSRREKFGEAVDFIADLFFFPFFLLGEAWRFIARLFTD